MRTKSVGSASENDESGSSISRRLFLSATLGVAGTIATPFCDGAEATVAPKSLLAPLTLEDCIESTRAQLSATSDDYEYVVRSPDSQKYAVMLISGDIAHDRVCVDIVVGGLGTLEESAPRRVAQLFTSGLAESGELTIPIANAPTWLSDSRHLIMHWSDACNVKQAIKVDSHMGTVEFLTEHQTDVFDFETNVSGDIIYCAQMAHTRERTEKLIDSGFAVTNVDAWGFMNGDADGRGLLDHEFNSEWFLKVAGAPKAEKISVPGDQPNLFPPSIKPSFSPDGRHAIFQGSPSDLPSDWSVYTHTDLQMRLKSAREGTPDPARQIRQLYVVNLKRPVARPLWNAPHLIANDTKIAWSPTSEWVLVGPVFLPPEQSSESGLSGNAISSVEIRSGRYMPLPISNADAREGVNTLRWISESSIEVTGPNHQWKCALTSGGWQIVSKKAPEAASTQSSGVKVTLSQDLNTPPSLIAAHPSGRRKILLELNPSLRGKELGVAELVEFDVDNHKGWRGILYRPTSVHGQMPLIIQSRGDLPLSEFSLWGPGRRNPGMGPGWSTYAARVLVSNGMAVLQVEDRKGIPLSDEPHTYMRAYRCALEHLSAADFIDRTRIGVMGFSRAAWRVTYALAHDDFPYAAAIASDGLSGGYVEASLLGWSPEFTENLNKSAPFGDGLAHWMATAPPFVADKINTPLQIQYGSGLLGMIGGMGAWELFSRLKSLQKPVEYYIVPNIRQGNHALQNPRQVLASKTRAIDWWKFWLQGHEDTTPTKMEQYRTWRIMREQQRAALARDASSR